MVRNCSVVGCRSEWVPSSGIKFHGFPKDDKRKDMWLSILPLKKDNYKNPTVCSLHFKEADYETRNKLKPLALPYYTEINDIKNSPCTSNISPEFVDMPVPSISSGIDTSTIKIEVIDEEFPINKKIKRSPSSEEVCNTCDTIEENNAPLMLSRTTQAKLKTAREKILSQKIKVLRTKLSRQTKRIEDMNDIIEAFKKYADKTEIENIMEGNFSNICKLLKKPCNNDRSTGARYSEEVKNFALTLHFYSPKAYEFIRTYIPLPHIQTLRRS